MHHAVFISKRIHQSDECTKDYHKQKKNKKGGNVAFEYLKNDIERVAATRNVLITTFLDFFRLPTDFPGYTTDSLKIEQIEEAVRENISSIVDRANFLPYIQRHEIEALMYTNMDGFNYVVDKEESLNKLKEIINQYANPEDINSGSETAPSKRLMKIFPYQKTTDGEIILEALPIDDIRSKCPRFNEWLENLENGIREDHF